MLDALRAIVGDGNVLVDDDVRAGYEVDWSGRFRGTTAAVVRPGSVDEVAAVLRACNESGTTVVPQGGNTGLVGGGVPLNGELVLSLQRLRAVGVVDELAAQVTAQAGATLASVQDVAHAARLRFAVDLSARASATIGGMVATNAGGLLHLRYGSMRANVVGIEAVLADGSVISHLGGLTKDNTGYDLAGLLCGSEGTLAVVTAARLRLVPPVASPVTAVLALSSVSAAVDAVVAMRAHVALEAAELWLDHPAPVREAPAYLLLEWDGPVDALGVVEAIDVAVAEDSQRRAELWRYREQITESINREGIPHKLDVTLPLRELAAFCDDVRAQVHHRVFLFGHVGDGNIHVNVIGPAPDDDAVDDQVLELVVARGGSISAEHGIGTAKKRWLRLNRSEAELATFRSIKRALDPRGILNPNVLL